MARQATGEAKLGRPFIYTSVEEQPVTLSLRVPRDLYARLEAYRKQHRQSRTELLIEGLKLVLDDGTDPYHPASNDTQHYGNTVTTEEASPRQPVPQTALTDMALTPGMLDIEDLDTADLDAMPLAPGDMSPQTDERPGGAPVPPFDAATHALSDLCRHGHDYHGTGQSLRRLTDGECMGCQSARARRSRQRQRQAGKEGAAPVEAHGEEAAVAVPAAKQRGRR